MDITVNEIDALDLSQALLRCPSITPLDAGALDVLEAALNELGFTCYRLPCFCFNHTS